MLGDRLRTRQTFAATTFAKWSKKRMVQVQEEEERLAREAAAPALEAATLARERRSEENHGSLVAVQTGGTVLKMI